MCLNFVQIVHIEKEEWIKQLVFFELGCQLFMNTLEFQKSIKCFVKR